MENNLTYNTLKNNFLNYLENGQDYVLTNNEHEALEDVACALNLGKAAYNQHCSIWLNSENKVCNISQDDLEYSQALTSIVQIVNNCEEI